MTRPSGRWQIPCKVKPVSAKKTLDVKLKWSFQTGGHSRQVQFACNTTVDRIFDKLENGLYRQGGLTGGGGSVPDRFDCIFVPEQSLSLGVMLTCIVHLLSRIWWLEK